MMIDDIVVRPLGSGDAPGYRALLEGATAEERYFRFFRPVHEVDASLIGPFVAADGAMLALLAADGAGRPLGAAHAFREDGGRRAELAVLVAHAEQHHGIGSRLVRDLIERLRAEGCGLLVARSLADNGRFSQLARSCGMTVREHSLGVLTWELPLSDASYDAPRTS